ncbi:MAG: MBL fold metallo-hydrolase [Burkholderiaceae bacterium]|nr:MBL fold metallo-hydrolase [Burkholderiaceae bacterium]
MTQTNPPSQPASPLIYPYGETLVEAGHTMEIAPGIYWIRMPLPFALDHINLWLLKDRIADQDGWTVIDCGITNDETKTHWESIFAKHLHGLPILRVLVTHMHPDHIGLAHFLCERWKAPLWVSMSDFLMAQWLSSKEGGVAVGASSGSGGAADHYARHGLVATEDLERIHEHHRARLSETLEACQTPKHAFEIIPVLFRRKLDNHQLSFAMGEAIAHLNYLWHQKKLRRSLCEDGIWRFCAASPL